MTEIRANRVHFFSQQDEENMFAWLESIASISSMFGEKDDIVLRFANGKISDSDLLEIIALFSRYNIDKKALSQFASEENQSWFCNAKMYWYQQIFGSSA